VDIHDEGNIDTRRVAVQACYRQFYASHTMQTLRGRTNVANTQNWTCLMLVYRAGTNKFIGVLL
jgi:hypothetical protein